MIFSNFFTKGAFVAFTLIVTCFGIIIAGHAEISESMIAGMWTFEEGEGTVATDMSGNGTDGEFIGNLEWVDAKFGGGLKFNGTDTWIKLGTKGDADSLAALQVGELDGFSVHAWVYSEVDPTGKCVAWKGLGCSTWSQFRLGTGSHENGVNTTQASFHIRAGNGGGRLEVLGNELPAKEWLHLVGTWNGTQNRIYVNGELQATADAAQAPWASPEEVYIGADPGCGRRGQWNGVMDEVAIFNVALSDAQVTELGEGIDAALGNTTPVDPIGKIATTWGKLKGIH